MDVGVANRPCVSWLLDVDLLALCAPPRVLLERQILIDETEIQAIPRDINSVQQGTAVSAVASVPVPSLLLPLSSLAGMFHVLHCVFVNVLVRVVFWVRLHCTP
jgi:hypothetical protein